MKTRRRRLTSPPGPLSQTAGVGEPADNRDAAPLSPQTRAPAKALLGFRGMVLRGGKGLGDRGVSLTSISLPALNAFCASITSGSFASSFRAFFNASNAFEVSPFR